MVDGNEYKTYDVVYGATITPEAEPTKEGYTFSGWSEIPKTMPAKDVIVTGTFVSNPTPVTTYTISIFATGNGSVSYNGNSIRSKTSTYSLDEGSSATFTITPDEGYRIKSVTLNNVDVTSSVSNNQFVTNNVSSDLNIEVEFEEIPVEPAIDYNLYVTCTANSKAMTQIGSSVNVTLGLGMTNSGAEDIVATKLVLKDPDTNNILSTITDANVLGELKGGTEKTFSIQINQAFESFPICELLYTLNNKEYSYVASDYRILSVTANDYGYLTFSGVSAGNTTKKFSLKPGDDAIIGIVPLEGAVLNKLTVNKSDVTSGIANNQYMISNVIANTSVTAIFDMNSGDIQTIDGHQYVDLGLPSGSYWSSVNYGATKPEEVGSYLSSVWSFSSQWGEHWIVPTKEDIQELIDECEWTWTEQNGQNGYSIKGPNGNTLFLPAAGEGSRIWGTSGVGTSIRYFTSSEAGYGSSYWILSGNSSEYQLKSNYITTEEYPVRPISTVKKEIPKHSLTYIVDGEVYKTYMLKVGENITPESEPTKNGYKFSGWSDIPEKMPDNDVTITGSFEKFYDVADIVSLVNIVMGIKVAEENDFIVYDLNNDDDFDIGDMVLVIKEIIRNMNSRMMARAETRTADPYVDLSRFTAAQFMLNVPAGCPIADIRLTGSNQSTHDVVWQQTDTGEYAVVIYSKANQKLSPEKGSIIDVIFADGNCSDMSISNVVLATPEGERVWLNSLPANATPTGISGLEKTETFDIYDMTGRKVRSQCHSLEGIASGVYIINGKKTVIK
ncbi:MAG: InlB B-repeat-containing protein [Prevotella sp.]|nr:InlB B-repeat-containing protein [Prevotella sp.]